MFFEDNCEDGGDYYIVSCKLLPHDVTEENAEILYEYIRNLRKLPKPFHFILDATQGKLFSFMPFIKGILKESKGGGVAPCLDAILYVPDILGLITLIAPVVASVSYLTNITLVPV